MRRIQKHEEVFISQEVQIALDIPLFDSKMHSSQQIDTKVIPASPLIQHNTSQNSLQLGSQKAVPRVISLSTIATNHSQAKENMHQNLLSVSNYGSQEQKIIKILACLQKCASAHKVQPKRRGSQLSFNKLRDIFQRLETDYLMLLQQCGIYAQTINQCHGLITNRTEKLIPSASEDRVGKNLITVIHAQLESHNVQMAEFMTTKQNMVDELKQLKREMDRACKKLQKVTGLGSKDLLEQCNYIVKKQNEVSSKMDPQQYLQGNLLNLDFEQKQDSKEETKNKQINKLKDLLKEKDVKITALNAEVKELKLKEQQRTQEVQNRRPDDNQKHGRDKLKMPYVSSHCMVFLKKSPRS